MKRFWKEVATAPDGDGWRILLDGRAMRTQGGNAQILPTAALAETMAQEWRQQGEEIDPHSLPMRDMADYAIDHISANPGDIVDTLLRYIDTDTLCYRADPEDALFERQQTLWEPILTAFEARHDLRLTRVSGVGHRPHPPASMEHLRAILSTQDAFALSALNVLTTLAASLSVALTVLETDAEPATLFAAANAEEDWQAEQWGWDLLAEENRALRLKAFETAAEFLRLSRG